MKTMRNACVGHNYGLLILASVCWIFTSYRCLIGNSTISDWVGGVTVWLALSGVVILSLSCHWLSLWLMYTLVLGGLINMRVEWMFGDHTPPIEGYLMISVWFALAVVTHLGYLRSRGKEKQPHD